MRHSCFGCTALSCTTADHRSRRSPLEPLRDSAPGRRPLARRADSRRIRSPELGNPIYRRDPPFAENRLTRLHPSLILYHTGHASLDEIRPDPAGAADEFRVINRVPTRFVEPRLARRIPRGSPTGFPRRPGLAGVRVGGAFRRAARGAERAEERAVARHPGSGADEDGRNVRVGPPRFPPWPQCSTSSSGPWRPGKGGRGTEARLLCTGRFVRTRGCGSPAPRPLPVLRRGRRTGVIEPRSPGAGQHSVWRRGAPRGGALPLAGPLEAACASVAPIRRSGRVAAIRRGRGGCGGDRDVVRDSPGVALRFPARSGAAPDGRPPQGTRSAAAGQGRREGAGRPGAAPKRGAAGRRVPGPVPAIHPSGCP